MTFRNHGTPSAYNTGCRCQKCRKVNRLRGRNARAILAARMAAGDPAVPHGTYGGYTNWACRCEACTRAGQKGRRSSGQAQGA